MATGWKKLLPLEDFRRIHLGKGSGQEVTAEKANLTYRHYQDIEAGWRPGIHLPTMAKIAKLFRVYVWQLLQPDRFPMTENERGRATGKIRR